MHYLKHGSQYVFRNDTMYFTVSVTCQLDMFGNILVIEVNVCPRTILYI